MHKQTESADHHKHHQHDKSDQHENSHNHSFSRVKDYVERFDSPSRDEWQKPEEVLDFIELRNTDKLADVGAGTGYFSIRAAQRLSHGIVYAVDAESNMLDYLNKRALESNLRNIETLKCEIGHLVLPEVVDVILLVNVYHHIHDRSNYFSNLRKWLSTNGKLVIIEGKLGTPMEPPPQHRLSPGQIEDELRSTKFIEMKNSSILPYQSLQLFKPDND